MERALRQFGERVERGSVRIRDVNERGQRSTSYASTRGGADRVERQATADHHSARSEGVDFDRLPYASKVTGLLEDLEMPTPPLGSIGIGELIARIDQSWDTRADLRRKINDRVPALRARAQQTNQWLLGLLEEHVLKKTDVTAPSGTAAPH